MLKNFYTVLFFLFSFCFAQSSETLSVSGFKNGITTDKIKIHSAYCLNSKWHFCIYDGIANKRFSLTMNVENSKGFKILAFDENTQTADIKTPYGNFKIGMFEAGETSKRNTPKTVAAQVAQEAKVEAEISAQNGSTTSKVVSRRAILNRIK